MAVISYGLKLFSLLFLLLADNATHPFELVDVGVPFPLPLPLPLPESISRSRSIVVAVASLIDAFGIWWLMGCISSKQANQPATSTAYKCRTTATVAVSVAAAENGSAVNLDPSSKTYSATTRQNDKKGEEKSGDRSQDLEKSKKEGSQEGKGSFKLGLSQRYVEAEQVAAGWPSWLSGAAGEAIHGWVPLRAESFEKLEKIGQGTYSTVFRARQVETGRMVALKKVRFDNFQPESIRFMAREIMILRKLDHPNIMQLQGIITSRMSTNIYLVFEYMEHDLAGLVSCPDIEFSEAQIKCYMRQLLSAMEHCHLRGVIHRDIKASNILVNNEGILKLADFGLANVINPRKKQALTSRVVTLWYRPPELLMGSTDYGLTVDLWSIGCVFAELHLGKPLFKGRTEVEQLHKIFKLCGSPPEEFWRTTKLPHAAMFRPQHAYERSLNEKCKEFAASAMSLLETFLAIEPHDRGTASSALTSDYFKAKPYACDPSTMPKYPPNKEMDAKNREDARRKRANARAKEIGAPQRPRRARRNLQEFNSHKVPIKEEAEENVQPSLHNNGGNSTNLSQEQAATAPNQRGDSAIPASTSNRFACVKMQKEEAKSTVSDGLKSEISALDPTFANYALDLTKKQNGRMNVPANSVTQDHEMQKQQRRKYDFPEPFDASEAYPFLDMSFELHLKPQTNATHHLDNNDMESHIEFSGPVLTQPCRVDELLQRYESHIQRVAPKSRFESDK